jgi:hypothetical protein
MFKKVSGLVLIGTLFVAAPASAQGLSNSALKVDFSAPALKSEAPAIKASYTPATPAPRQGGGGGIVPFLLGGLVSSGDFGFAIGGGARKLELAGNPNFAVQFDGLYSNVGGCSGCDIFGGDFSARTIAFSGAFIYLFDAMSSGWRPEAGGGIVIGNFSYDTDDDIFDFCDIIGGCSATSGGIQVQGGIGKNRVYVGARAQSIVGGSFIFEFRYSFGGAN